MAYQHGETNKSCYIGLGPAQERWLVHDQRRCQRDEKGRGEVLGEERKRCEASAGQPVAPTILAYSAERMIEHGEPQWPQNLIGIERSRHHLGRDRNAAAERNRDRPSELRIDEFARDSDRIDQPSQVQKLCKQNVGPGITRGGESNQLGKPPAMADAWRCEKETSSPN